MTIHKNRRNGRYWPYYLLIAFICLALLALVIGVIDVGEGRQWGFETARIGKGIAALIALSLITLALNRHRR